MRAWTQQLTERQLQQAVNVFELDFSNDLESDWEASARLCHLYYRLSKPAQFTSCATRSKRWVVIPAGYLLSLYPGERFLKRCLPFLLLQTFLLERGYLSTDVGEQVIGGRTIGALIDCLVEKAFARPIERMVVKRYLACRRKFRRAMCTVETNLKAELEDQWIMFHGFHLPLPLKASETPPDRL